MKTRILIFLILIIHSTAWSENYAILVGGSGEDFKENNFFLEDFTRFHSYLEKRGFKTVSAFDNAKSEGKFATQKATNKNIDQMLDQVLANAKEGDQVALVIHTHGSQPALFGVHGHEVMTESGSYDLVDLIPKIRKSKAKILLVDLSCYSGNTQNLVLNSKSSADSKKDLFSANKTWQERSPMLPSDADKRLCIISGASPYYVSICSGDASSNTFTTAMLESLAKSDRKSANNLFLESREKDRSFTNMPQISSFTAAFESKWDDWLRVADPAILKAGSNETEAECKDCEEKARKKLSQAFGALAKELGQNTVKKLFEDYQKARQGHGVCQAQYSEMVWRKFSEIVSRPENRAYSNLKPSQVRFYVNLRHVPALEMRETPTGSEFTGATKEFLDSFQYLSPKEKQDMMASQSRSHKTALSRIFDELEAETAAMAKTCRGYAEKIQDISTQLLSEERQKYKKAFQPKEGHACQSFQL